MNTQNDFEQWAKLLISRKVPEDCRRFIDPDVIHTGADILKRGGAFEVHLEEAPAGHIFVTPIPRAPRAANN